MACADQMQCFQEAGCTFVTDQAACTEVQTETEILMHAGKRGGGVQEKVEGVLGVSTKPEISTSGMPTKHTGVCHWVR